MSRGGDDDYDENFPNEAQFWWANAQRALKGKRGRKALAELREALLMLPEKRLVSGAISTAPLRDKYQDEPDDVQSFNNGGLGPNWRKRDAMAKCEKEGIGVCAVGAYLLRKRVIELGETPEDAMSRLPALSDTDDYSLYDTMVEGQRAGLSSYVAWILADRNDETFGSLTPEDRFDAFLEWIDKELAAA